MAGKDNSKNWKKFADKKKRILAREANRYGQYVPAALKAPALASVDTSRNLPTMTDSQLASMQSLLNRGIGVIEAYQVSTTTKAHFLSICDVVSRSGYTLHIKMVIDRSGKNRSHTGDTCTIEELEFLQKLCLENEVSLSDLCLALTRKRGRITPIGGETLCGMCHRSGYRLQWTISEKN